MPKTPSISVVVPMYNVEHYIKICIDSILAQTFQDFEIIIVDDASPDNSYKLCKKLYGGNKKVRIVRHEKNQGLGPARNTGIKNSRGKYIFFVDSDDAILPRTLEIFYNAAENSGAEVVHSSQYYETTQDNDAALEINKFTLEKDPHQVEGFITTDRIYRWENCWQRFKTADGIRPMSVLNLYQSDIFEKYNLYFEPMLSEDEVFSFEIFAYVDKFFVINQPCYVYRQRDTSIMGAKNLKKMSKGISAFIVAIDKIKAVMNRFPNLRGKTDFQEHFINRLLDCLWTNYVKPLYQNGLTQEVDTAVDGALQETFGKNTTFVKYLFHATSDLRVRIVNLSEQANQLNAAYHQLIYRHQQTELFLNEQADILKLLDEMKFSGAKIFLVGTPNHGNLGDHAIAVAEYFVLKNLFPNHKIIEIPFRYLTGLLGEIFNGLGFEKYVKPTDLIAMLGGGNLGNLWVDEEIFRRNIIKKFNGNKILIFPQSIHFTNDETGQKELNDSAQIYNAHPDLHLMLRDENSFNLANKIFPNINTYLLPDVVTALFGILDNVNVKRDGVLFILRSDKEKIRDDSIVKNLQEFLTQNNISFNVIDTVIKETVYKNNREKKIYDVLMKIRQSRLVITDRFHGVIFSYITRTPVMAFKSFDTKISSGIKWFKDLSSIFYAENADLGDMKNFITKFYNPALPEKIELDFRKNFMDVLYYSLMKPSKDFSLEKNSPFDSFNKKAVFKFTDDKNFNEERVKKLIFLAIPMSICNFRCHYCYLSQRSESYQGVQPEMKYSPEYVAKALSPKRLGGLAYINVCADGETLWTRDIEIYMRRLAEEGHYIEIVTNCTITPVLKKFLAWDKELLAHIEFKCSFHYLELKKRNMLDVFAENVNAIWKAGASANVEITPSDELIPYIDEVKNFSLKHFGALPHITIARDDRTKNIEILSKLPKDEYYKLWGQFDSQMFDYKKTVFGKRQEEFCYAGIWSANINLCTGQARPCYCGRNLGDVFANPDSDFPTFPVGKCSIAHCYNAHAFMTLGNIPHSTKITFADIRNRVRTDGREWLNPKLKKFFGTQLYQSNRELGDMEKFNFMLRNLLL